MVHVRGACWGDRGAPAAQVKTIWYVGVASFCWSCVRWLFSRSGVPFCGGFELMPTFGRAALRQVGPCKHACGVGALEELCLGACTLPAALDVVLKLVLLCCVLALGVLTRWRVRADNEL